jgi:hypothetical protein
VFYSSLGVLPILVSLLSNDNMDIKIQAVIVIGSLGQCDTNLDELLKLNLIPKLLELLVSNDSKLLEAVGRSLKWIFRNNSVPKNDIFNGNIVHIIKLLNFHPELGATIIALASDSLSHQQHLSAAIPTLVSLTNGNTKIQQAAVDALSSLSSDNPTLSQLIYSPELLAILNNMLTLSPISRLKAASLLTHLFRSNTINLAQITPVIPTLVGLLKEDKSILERVPLIVAYLVSESSDLQGLACDHGMVSELKRIIETEDKILEASLLCIASICSLREESRKQIIEAKLLPVIVKSLSNPNPRIRSAACQATRSISRSVKALRTSLVDAGINVPLFNLLKDTVQIQITATATICNLVLDFSPMKKSLLESEYLDILTSLTKSCEIMLRLNAVWAIKNLLFQSDSEVKKIVIGKLGWDTVCQLAYDPDNGVEEQGLNLIRNLVCGKQEDIEYVFNGIGNRLIPLLEQKLHSSDSAILQALYVIVNISTGSENHKTAIMNSENILKRIMTLTVILLF